MLNRLDTLHLWLSNTCQFNLLNFMPLTGDASFRRYYRIYGNFFNTAPKNYMLMDSPSPQEKIDEFVKISKILQEFDIHVPHIIQKNLQDGFLILEDFGDRLLLDELNNHTADFFYHHAIDILVHIQSHPYPSNLPKFDIQHMYGEMELFTTWFIGKHLDLTLTNTELDLIKKSFLYIAESIASHPKVLIHRDFHSRNLMVLQDNQLGVIDFQDAMIGPQTYDFVSLLKDCYIEWPVEKQREWCHYGFQQFYPEKLTFEQFWQEFNLCGLQRHLKVLGIFCRLFYRDHKSRYLNDLPLTWHYMYQALSQFPELAAFKQFIDTRIQLAFDMKVNTSC